VIAQALPERWTELRPHPVQHAYYRSRSRFNAVAAGRRSGKTELARRRVVRYLCVQKPWPDPLYFYALPTRAQAHLVAWPALKALVPAHWEPDVSESEMSIGTKFGSRLYVVGMDKPQRIEGVGWDGGVVDESCDQKPFSFDRTIRPALSDRRGWCDRIGVPKRAGCGAQEFKRWYHRGLAGEAGIQSFTWPSWDILDPAEVADARDQLDVKDFNEQYGASWETVGGQVFYAYDSALNLAGSETVYYRRDLPLLIGCDFNVDPMAWVVCQAVAGELHVLDELFIRNTNTAASLQWLAKKYGQHPCEVRFYGDATGRARKTAASESDYVQIRNTELFGKDKTRVFFPVSNPQKQDRFAATNAMLCSASGKRRMRIHPRCQNLQRDLESRAYKPGTSDPDDHDDVGHITDAVGYLVFQLYPLRVALSVAEPTVSAV
jgi:hypothetical protein